MGQSSAFAHLPLVSVVIPAYNAERFIAKTLRSVLAQTYSNFEVLVINDGSTDRTPEIVGRFAQRDARVRLLSQLNAGVAAARNLGIRQAQGELIAPIDADDLWYPNNLAKQVEQLIKSPESVGLVYSWSVDVDQQDRQTGGFHAARVTGKVHATLLCHNFLGNASCTLIRRSCLLAVGGYNEQFQVQQVQGCEDWDLYLRLAEQYEFGVVPEFLVGYRKLRQSMSYNYQRMANSHGLVLQAVQQRCPQLPKFLYGLSRSSLYIYFAHQCSDNGDDRSTLYWLKQAVQADLTPWIRLGSYQLALKSLVNLARQGFRSSPETRYGAMRYSANPLVERSRNREKPHRLHSPLYSPSSMMAWMPLLQGWQVEVWDKRLVAEGKQSASSSLALPALWQEQCPTAVPGQARPLRPQLEKPAGPSRLQVTFKVWVGSTLHTVLSLLGQQ